MSDTFGETLDERGSGESKFKKTVWLTLKPGDYTIRILDPMETKKYGHYFQGRGWIECLGDECPICQNNRKILYEHPQDYKDVQGWNPRRARFFLNVLDREDGLVKVLGCGPTLIEDIKVMSKSIRNEQDERIDIRHYDWMLTVKGEGRDKNTIPSHKYYGKETSPEIGEQTLYDLDNLMIKLEPDEMLDVANGASLKDVFALRKAAKQAKEDEFGPADKELADEIDKAVEEMFNS